MEQNSIIITDDDGKEVEMQILLTFEANDKKYVVVHPKGNEDEIYGFVYDEEGNLFVVENEEELSMIEEVVGSFDGDLDEEDA